MLADIVSRRQTLEARSGRSGFLIAVLVTVLAMASFPPPRAVDPFDASVTITVAPDAYQNVIRVAPPDAMDWPHIVVDRNPGSPFEGYLYLIGTKDTIQNNALWTALVVVRSPDGGRTFDAPRLFEAFRGISFSSAVRIVDIVTDRNGFLYLAFEGNGILRSTDAGLSWEFHQVFAGFRYVTAVSVDPTSGSLFAVETTTTLVGAFGFAWRETWHESIGNNVSIQQNGIYAALSSDAGATFSAPVQIVVGAYDLYAPEVALALDNRSRTYAAWSVPPATLNDFGSLYAAVSNATATGFDNASFKVSLQARDGYLTAQEDLGAGTNGTVYLAWSALNYSDPQNFTIDNETSGIFLRTVSGFAVGQMTDPSRLLVNTTAVVEFRDPIARGPTLRIPWNGSAIVPGALAPNASDVWIVTALGDRRAGAMPVQPLG